MTTGLFITAASCPYDPRMTRAQAMALRASGGLRENCVVVITDGPTIGVAGSQSATEIELNPVSPTAFGLAARVFTTYDNTAWAGLYDIDLGTQGSITRLQDNRGNIVTDIDADSPTVHTQFPWGKFNFRENRVDDCTLTGLDVLSSTFNMSDCVLSGSTLDFTGYAGVTLTWNSATFRSAYAVFAGAAGVAASSITRSVFELGNAAAPVLADRRPSGNGSYSITDSHVFGSYTLEVAHTSGSVSIASSELHGGTAGTVMARFGGPAAIADSELIGPHSGGFARQIDVQDGSLGQLSVTRSRFVGGALLKEAGPAGAILRVQDSTLESARITVATTNGVTNLFSALVGGSFVADMRGPASGGTNFVRFAYINGLGINIAAGATATINIQQGTYVGGSIININRAAGSHPLGFYACDLRGVTTITDQGTTAPGAELSFNRCQLTDSTITVGDMSPRTGPGLLQQSRIVGSTLNISGMPNNGFLSRLEMLGCVLNNNGFPCENVILQSGVNKTFTAANNLKIANVAFDNVV